MRRFKRKGYSYFCTLDQIREYSRLSPRDKLNWLEEANRFTAKVLKGKTKMVWEMLREGKL